MRVPPFFDKQYVDNIINDWIKGISGITYDITKTPLNPQVSSVDRKNSSFFQHVQDTCQELSIPLHVSIFPSATGTLIVIFVLLWKTLGSSFFKIDK